MFEIRADDAVEAPPRKKRKMPETTLPYSNSLELCEHLTEPFLYPPNDIPCARATIPLLHSDPQEKIICQASLTPEILHFCPYLLPCHPMAFDENFLSLSYVLAGIFDSERDIFMSGIPSEDDYHSLWDSLIRRPLVYLCKSTRHLNKVSPPMTSSPHHGESRTSVNNRADPGVWI
jgi:hypothetical protein